MYYYRVCVYNSQSSKEKGKKAFERILSYDKIPPFPFEVILSSLKVLFGLKSVVTFEMSEDDTSDCPKYDFSGLGIDPVFFNKGSHDSKK